MRIGDVFLTPDLRIGIGEHASAPLTPRNGLRLAEQLLRGSVRAALTEEEVAAAKRRDAPTPRLVELSRKAKA